MSEGNDGARDGRPVSGLTLDSLRGTQPRRVLTPFLALDRSECKGLTWT
ncbi:putative protein without homology [Propionibacterium freudenreichii subsp. shermanii]|nr:putative protein without homology [Propionibacterium freudenreichii subsp. shermanii]